MPRIPLGISAALFIATAMAIVPSEGMAFDMENAAATVPGGTQFQDPDEDLLVAPGSLPLLKDDTSDSSNFQPSGSTLQLTPGTMLHSLPPTKRLAPGMASRKTRQNLPIA